MKSRASGAEPRPAGSAESRRPLIASTHNAHKLVELRSLLAGLPVQLRTASEVGVDDVEETGLTFEDNALLKAAAAFERTGELAMADDSGLAVDALDGGPGVMSARFAGEDVTYADNNALLLEKLAGVPEERRGAAFVCTIALLVPEAQAVEPPGGAAWRRVRRPDVPAGAALYVIEGRVEGRIIEAPRGVAGFGYDPLFLYPPAGLTFAELPAGEKNAVSHRGRALSGLRGCLERLLSGRAG